MNNTIVYFIRHSKTLNVNNELSNDGFNIKNEKVCLSIDGEKMAQNVLYNPIFSNIESVYSSNYVRAIATAKYLEKKVNVIDNFGERKHGNISSWDSLPIDYEKKQLEDENYKLENGESQKEVRDRMYTSLIKVMKENYGKNILVVSHATAITFLLTKWCDIDNYGRMIFQNKIIFNGQWDYCEIFKLVFDRDNNLINLENIKL